MESNKKGLTIIGGGMAGLTAGIAWAMNNDVKTNPVLLIEKEPKTGGEVTSVMKKGYIFDTCQMITNLEGVFNYLGIDLELKAFKGHYMRVFMVNPGKKEVKIINLPSGRESFKQHLMNEYPSEAQKVEKLLDHSYSMFIELNHLKCEPGFVDFVKTIVKCPKIVRNASKTFEEYYKQFNIQNKDIDEIFGAFAALSGLPENKVAAMLPTGVMHTCLEGTYRPKKGFIELPQQMEKRFLELGGELRTKKEVEKILTENGVAKGVRLSDGEVIHSDYIITTVDTKLAMEKLVGLDVIEKVDKAYARKAREVKMSPSSMNIWLGLDDELDLAALGLDCGYNIVTTCGNTFEQLYNAFLKGENAMSEECFHIGVICPSLTTGGKPNITIRVVPMAPAYWMDLRTNDREKYMEEKEKWGDFFINLAEKYVIPNLRKHIVIKDISTPATYARFNGSPSASIYDMSPFPSNFGRTRLNTRTPIKGLFQPKFSHGVFGAINGALQAVDMILDRKIMGGNARFPL